MQLSWEIGVDESIDLGTAEQVIDMVLMTAPHTGRARNISKIGDFGAAQAANSSLSSVLRGFQAQLARHRQ